MIVVDASAFADFLLGSEPWVDERLHGEDMAAPQLLDYEVASALRRLESAALVATDHVTAALADLIESPLDRYPPTELLPRMWELRGTLTAYDAAYVALAESLDVPLVTTDRRLARSHGHSATIESP